MQNQQITITLTLAQVDALIEASKQDAKLSQILQHAKTIGIEQAKLAELDLQVQYHNSVIAQAKFDIQRINEELPY